MIPCTEFIPAYSELFKFLESRGGKEGVVDFWNYLSANIKDRLRNLVKEHGLRGCWLYWSATLNEEAADFTMELDEEAAEFRIIMHRCPSKGRLLEYEHIEPYHDYCGHCEVMFKRVLLPLGYEYILDKSECDQARCTILIRAKSTQDVE